MEIIRAPAHGATSIVHDGRGRVSDLSERTLYCAFMRCPPTLVASDPVTLGAEGRSRPALSGGGLDASLGLTAAPIRLAVLRCAWRPSALVAECARVIVLGHRLAPEGSGSTRYRQRFDHVTMLLRGLPHVTVLLRAGRSAERARSEADVGADVSIAHGSPAPRTRREHRSGCTPENLRRCCATFVPARPGRAG